MNALFGSSAFVFQFSAGIQVSSYCLVHASLSHLLGSKGVVQAGALRVDVFVD